MMSPTPSVTVTPTAALTDEPVAIRLSGFTPEQTVTLRARTRGDDFGRAWESYAVFQADADGQIEPGVQAPLAGTYQGIDPMGLFWSMELDPAAEEECYFRKSDLQPVQVTFTAEVDGQAVASAQAERLFVAPGVERAEVREEGLVGVLFRPAGDGPHPAVIVLGGGDGGIRQHGAALLASHGYTALALAYFNTDPLPARAEEIPLEYFGTAVCWLQAQPQVDAQHVALCGTSLGGMFALLAASTFSAIRAVVCYVPMGLVLCGEDGKSPVTYQGRSWPCVPVPEPTPAELAIFEQQSRAGQPFSPNPLFLRLLQDEAAVALASIPVERINGPVLLVTGHDDQALPSPAFAEQVVARLERHDFPYPHRHLTYPGAGHAIGLPHAHGLPYVPTYGRAPASGPVFAFGGNPCDDAFANVDSWRQVRAFLAQNLGIAPRPAGT